MATKTSRVNRVTFTVEAETGKCDGYAEFILGMFSLSEMFLSNPKLSRKVEGNKTTIAIQCEMKNPPLGHLGEDDIYESN